MAEEASVARNAQAASANAGNERGGGAEFTCSVCLETEPRSNKAVMPCCERESSTISFCTRCVEIICERSPGRVGRCPTCRAFICVRSGGDQKTQVELTTRVAQCLMCRQERTIIDENLCDGCLLGRRYALVYECDGCNNWQRIPHPMWRYQSTPTEFGAETWACHVGCGDFTHWRVVAQEVEKIPAQEYPESWGRKEEWLGQVREQRRQEIKAGKQLPPPGMQRHHFFWGSNFTGFFMNALHVCVFSAVLWYFLRS